MTDLILSIVIQFAQVIVNPTALRKAKIVHNFGLSECNRVKKQLRDLCQIDCQSWVGIYKGLLLKQTCMDHIVTVVDQTCPL